MTNDNAGSRDGSFDYLGRSDTPPDLDLLTMFLAEADERTAAAEKTVLELEANPASTSGIGELFRVLHTIKGEAGFLGLTEIVELSHAIEHYLEPFRDGESELSSISADLLLEGLDALRHLFSNLSARVNSLKPGGAAPEFLPTDWAGLSRRFMQASGG